VRLEERISSDHPLRAIRHLADEALVGLNGRFDALYSGMRRPSISPEMILRATLLQAFLSPRCERHLGSNRFFEIGKNPHLFCRKPLDAVRGSSSLLRILEHAVKKWKPVFHKKACEKNKMRA